MNEHDAFRVIPQEVADTVVAILVAAVLIFGVSPDVLAWIGRFL